MSRIANFVSKYWFAALISLLASAAFFAMLGAIDRLQAISKACTINGMIPVQVDGNRYCVEPEALIPVEAE